MHKFCYAEYISQLLLPTIGNVGAEVRNIIMRGSYNRLRTSYTKNSRKPLLLRNLKWYTYMDKLSMFIVHAKRQQNDDLCGNEQSRNEVFYSWHVNIFLLKMLGILS